MDTFVIDGNNFSTYKELCNEFNQVVFKGFYNQWHGSLDAFNDLLRDVYGIILWKNFSKSKKDLSYLETVKILEERLEYCHPSNRSIVREELTQARSGKGPTILDWVLEIIAEQDIEVVIFE
ncbi:hypothetical protein [Brevibacillus choshinensis]|uniref:hypothetical protein n=1 Tax=Brevibacillus choshinensis TaxID=54911 RepID=UPI002E23EF40|nr:hypothetical protein [Brevibacillus choshinensis]MED4784238.1 hypothetical protein [Brevibacillus choshinensis]